GDVAVYDALVRLAQDFAVRYPLVDGQGNFGSIDGDGAAAMRYTEARMTEVAEALLDGINEDAVDFRDTYDGDDHEPELLPAGFPNLLANGAMGIAVGMATSIPPHNAGELCDALLHLLKSPEATVAKLVDLVPGPDFPGGGVLVEPRAAVERAYGTGRGGFRLRARWSVEKQARGQYEIVVTEIPYQIQAGRLVEKIAEMMAARKLPMLADIRDESAADLRLVLVPKSRGIEAEMIMEALFKHTDLEVRVGLNMNVLNKDGVPLVMGLREALAAFLAHRETVLIRRTRYRLAAIERRLEILGGYLVVYTDLDEVIRIIREDDAPKAALMKRFELSELQAESILNMRLRALRRLEEEAMRVERAALTDERKQLGRLLRGKDLRRNALAEQIRDIRKRFGAKTALGRRRTELGTAPTATVVPLEALVEREPITVVCSQKGWIRAVKGHVEDAAAIKYKEGDRARFSLRCQTTDKLLLFGTNGRFYTLGCDRLPGGRGHGEPVRLMVDLGNDQELVNLRVHNPEGRLVVAASDGRGFVVPEAEVVAQTRAGKQVLNVKGDVEAQACTDAAGELIAVVGTNRRLHIFPTAELPVMSRGRGVVMQRYAKGGLSDLCGFDRADGLRWTSGARTHTRMELDDWIGKRAQAGRKPPAGFPSVNR
ncbi:MAG: DNA topoisomerase IV subunit A, partial [Alphaproteobacteria bacterium]